ncbi:MAG: hypothetical protein ACYCVD_05600 [Desulfitobacteriaceae bacterium]
MERKKVIRTLVTLSLFLGLVAVIVISQFYDPTNPHSTMSRETLINGPKGHGYTVLNNQQPWKQCYPCHVKKGLGGQEFCISCHEKSGVKVNIPQPPAK